MNKLTSKVFSTIFFFLTGIFLFLCVIFSAYHYDQLTESIKTCLEAASQTDSSIQKFINKYEIDQMKDEQKNYIDILDHKIYIVLFNDEHKITDVINSTNDGLSKDEIIQIGRTIIEENDYGDFHIGNLLTEQYSYYHQWGKSLIIVDQSHINEVYKSDLLSIIIFFIIGDAVILLLTMFITSWIARPARESFNKQKLFIADASHELKTPLSVIIASSEALKDHPEDQKLINNIHSEAVRMNILISKLLKLASSENDELYDFKTGNLSKVIELATLPYEARGFEKNINIDLKIGKNIEFLFDENDIKQVIDVLLDNALSHAYSNSTIIVILRESKHEIRLAVINKGDPIPKGDENKIFERFYRADKSRNQNENRYGLGLAITKNIVESHNGKIVARSEDSITTFLITFKK